MLTETDIDTYLEGIAALGFNGTVVTVPESFYSRNSPTFRNANGALPFTGTNFRSPLNDPYWRTIDHMIQKGASLGITFVVTPQYLGYAADGWASAIAAAYDADPLNLTRYGEALAARYGSSPNIVWMIGHDRSSIESSALNGSVNIAKALQANTTQLLTIGGAPDLDPDAAWRNAIPWDFTTVYDYGGTPGADTKSVHYANAHPCIWLEGIYEDEHGSGLGALIHRRQMWEPILAGASAAVFGNSERWQFSSDVYVSPPAGGSWQQSLTTPPYNKGSVHVSRLAALLAAVPAVSSALPDHTNTFLTSGEGFARFGTPIGVVYQTAAAPITLDTTELEGTRAVRIRRYDPTSGVFSIISASEAQSSVRVIPHAGRNAAGDNDWVYVVDLV